MSESEELAAKLARRQEINEGEEMPKMYKQNNNVYTEFKEFSRKQIKDFEAIFKKYDINNDKSIDQMELKLMMEKLGAPQTHISLLEMIREVDEDKDNAICFREFLIIFRKAAKGELAEDSGLYELYKNMDEIDVDSEGVKGAAGFFESKIKKLNETNKFEEEIRQEQEEKKKQAEEAKARKAAFKEKANLFKQA